MTRILYFENGRASDKAKDLLCTNIPIHSVPLSEASQINYHRYEVLIIPSYSNQDILRREWPRISRFIVYGGVAVVMGAVQDKVSWLPVVAWHGDLPRDVKICHKDTPDGQLILDGLDKNLIKFHEFFSHGSFVAQGADTLSLIETPNGESILAILRLPKSEGRLLVTTLDPDHHASCGYHILRLPQNVYAQRLFNNLVKWSVHEAHAHSSPLAMLQRIAGFSKPTIILAGVVSTSGLLVISVVAFLLGFLSSFMFEVITGLASIISLGLSLRLLLFNR